MINLIIRARNKFMQFIIDKESCFVITATMERFYEKRIETKKVMNRDV
jgi:hypothetical protein